MKKTLTLLALMIAVAGAGQKPDTLNLGGVMPYGVAISSSDSTFVFLFGKNEAQPKYDTVAIVYLYSDTTRPTWQDVLSGDEYYSAKWDFGYEVREEAGLIPITVGGYMLKWVMDYNHIGYLDRQKQPMRKTMIVWQVKQLQ